jgi:hypothetical protein
MLPYDHRVFRGNGAFDPDQSGIGHQPFGFDQWCSGNSFYSRYRVIQTTCKLKFINHISLGLFVALYPSASNGSPTSWGNAAEIPRCKTAEVGPISGQPIKQLINRISTREFFGYRDITQEDLFAALYNANPPLEFYWNIYVEVSDQTTHAEYAFSVELTYDIEFFDRTQIGQS